MTKSRTVVTFLLALCMAVVTAIGSNARELRLRSTNSVFVAPPQNSEQLHVTARGRSKRAVKAEKKSGINPIARISLSSLTATRERPIFSPSRRPPPVQARTPIMPIRHAARTRPNFTLLGTISAGRQGMAILLDQKNGTVLRLKVGEGRLGWTLRRVEAQEATLQNNRQTAVLSLPNPSGK